MSHDPGNTNDARNDGLMLQLISDYHISLSRLRSIRTYSFRVPRKVTLGELQEIKTGDDPYAPVDESSMVRIARALDRQVPKDPVSNARAHSLDKTTVDTGPQSPLEAADLAGSRSEHGDPLSNARAHSLDTNTVDTGVQSPFEAADLASSRGEHDSASRLSLDAVDIPRVHLRAQGGKVQLLLPGDLPTGLRQINVAFDSKRFGRYQSDEDVFARGATSVVYTAVASLANGDSSAVKVAIKVLKSSTPQARFLAEHKALTAVRTSGHPNIVQLIQAFAVEGEAGSLNYHLMFPLAGGDLQGLFHGLLHQSPIESRSHTLWTQFEGLATALRCLHVDYGMAHQDITPANILLYVEPQGLHLVAKLADFGLAVDYIAKDVAEGPSSKTRRRKTRRRAEPTGSRAGRAVGFYQDFQTTSKTTQDLLARDVWDVGSVFIELLTFLTFGVSGVRAFRSHVATAVYGVEADTVTDIRFDDEFTAKVISWLCKLVKTNHRAAELGTILASLFGAVSQRPDIRQLVERLQDSSACYWWDGHRAVHFEDAVKVPKPSYIDRQKQKLERRLQSQIDWWPLRHGSRSCDPLSTRISWHWGGDELSIDVPANIADSYRSLCRPLSAIPASSSSPSTWTPQPTQGPPQSNQAATSPAQSQCSNTPSPASSYNPSPHITQSIGIQMPHSYVPRRLYWCVDSCWSEPATTRRVVVDVSRVLEDEMLFRTLRLEYDRSRGLRGRILSWKSCQDVEFIRFCMIYKDQDAIGRIDEGLPPANLGEYEYTLTKPEQVHMIIAAKQIVAGMDRPEHGRSLLTLPMVPKHLPAPQNANTSVECWGIHAVQGWSLRKIMCWIAGLNALGMTFVVLWLCFVSKTDLQNAFIPVTFFQTMIMIMIAVPQFVNAA
ncbi:hypothetical protein LTR97_012462 [Elasticomyces elasticus]|uniref:Protein kinase domain-containing protein n=1 Tax=Elasticomyces elasticus TaxID=574655 RepID=A0AAN7W236_9PEZI|nr:hypothetical protein LTR97_012462 [Elasticomyces elasticus]